MKKLTSMLIAVFMLIGSVNISAAGLKDVTDEFRSDKEEIFRAWEGFVDSYDYKTASDEEIYSALAMPLDGIHSTRYNATQTADTFYNIWKKSDFTAMTNELYGVTVDYDKITGYTDDSEWNAEIRTDNCVYLSHWYHPYVWIENCDIHSIKKIDADKYYVTFTNYIGGTGGFSNRYEAAMIVKKIGDRWTLLRGYTESLPSENEVIDYVKPSSWARDEVYIAEAAGLVPKMIYDPEYGAVITRRQFSQLVVNIVEEIMGKPLNEGAAFADCDDTAVKKAYKAGIVNGVSASEFNPDGLLSREQLATMLWRAISYIESESGDKILEASHSLSGFSDKNTISDWAITAVTALNSNGIMKGTSDSTISPAEKCTVEQSILLAFRMYKKAK